MIREVCYGYFIEVAVGGSDMGYVIFGEVYTSSSLCFYRY